MEWDKHMGAFSFDLESGDYLVCQLKCQLTQLHRNVVCVGLVGHRLCVRLRAALPSPLLLQGKKLTKNNYAVFSNTFQSRLI